jgi:hypothetical protein
MSSSAQSGCASGKHNWMRARLRTWEATCSGNHTFWVIELKVLECLIFTLEFKCMIRLQLIAVVAPDMKHCFQLSSLRLGTAIWSAAAFQQEVIDALDPIADIHASRHELANASRALKPSQRPNHQTMPFSCEGRSATGSINVNVLRELLVESSTSRRLTGCACVFCPSKRSYVTWRAPPTALTLSRQPEIG